MKSGGKEVREVKKRTLQRDRTRGAAPPTPPCFLFVLKLNGVKPCRKVLFLGCPPKHLRGEVHTVLQLKGLNARKTVGEGGGKRKTSSLWPQSWI